MHDFEKKLKDGKDAELVLDAHFAGAYFIEPVSLDKDKKGVDRYFTGRTTGLRWAIEYKADWRAEETGNVFIETVSVDTTKKRGWAYTSTAQRLVYYLPKQKKAYICDMSKIKCCVGKWQKRYKEVPSHNDGYDTKGLPVPLGVFIAETDAKEVKL